MLAPPLLDAEAVAQQVADRGACHGLAHVAERGLLVERVDEAVEPDPPGRRAEVRQSRLRDGVVEELRAAEHRRPHRNRASQDCARAARSVALCSRLTAGSPVTFATSPSGTTSVSGTGRSSLSCQRMAMWPSRWPAASSQFAVPGSRSQTTSTTEPSDSRWTPSQVRPEKWWR